MFESKVMVIQLKIQKLLWFPITIVFCFFYFFFFGFYFTISFTTASESSLKLFLLIELEFLLLPLIISRFFYVFAVYIVFFYLSYLLFSNDYPCCGMPLKFKKSSFSDKNSFLVIPLFFLNYCFYIFI